MKRIDSGFQESFLLKAAHNGPTPIVRSNTAPTRRRNPKKTTVDSMSPVHATGMESQRPASEKRSRPSHQRSKTSSSETSTTRSRGRGQGSKPSSRRTSCTIVDPSRSRHYRLQSSNTVPTATRQDIDDVYALHHRSYSLFQNSSLQTKSGLPSPTLSQANHFGLPSATSRFSADDAHNISQHNPPKQSEPMIAAAEPTTVTMHWTSPCTRRREYDRIDKANSGFRGFLNKVMPRCVSGSQEKFYEKDQSDVGSVRRYRIGDEEENEKELSQSKSRIVEETSTIKKRWICF